MPDHNEQNFIDLLNTATPFAPKNDVEARDRILPFVGEEEPEEEVKRPRRYEPPLEPPDTAALRYRAEAEAVHEEPPDEGLGERLRELECRLESERYEVNVLEGMARIGTDGHGTLLAIEVDAAAAGARGTRSLGSALVQAINTAARENGERARALRAELLGGESGEP
ncbi:YbaB/EbfC family nucleoid-associated protein [Actinocorallia libanotica]|uniref:YbaB/EbfC DNA-binding family protein n=1 Tax=Actinocorallia libanotica TaxID=46162 RepID=A0ABP4C6M5_9ACTN